MVQARILKKNEETFAVINFLKRNSSLIRFLTIMGLILPAILPVKSWVLAQNEIRYLSSSNEIYTSEFGIENPEGMVYSPEADSFIVWGKNKGNNAISLHNESSKKISLPQNPENPLGTAYDGYSKSLFTLDAGNTALIKTGIGDNIPARRFDLSALRLQDVQGVTFNPATGQLFVLDAGGRQILTVSPHPVDGFNEIVGNRIRRVNLESLS